MAEIVLCRIDSRLIHGQVMTKWVNQSQANKIVVVSDELANDEFMLEIYLLSAPAGVKIECYGIEDTIKNWNENQFGTGKVLLLLPDLKSMKQIYDGGVNVSQIQVGGLGGAPNRKVVFQNITLDDPDTEILEDLSAKGVNIIFQTIPEDSPMKFDEILNVIVHKKRRVKNECFRCSYIYGLLLLVLQTSVWVYILICIAAACYDCSICRIDYRRYGECYENWRRTSACISWGNIYSGRKRTERPSSGWMYCNSSWRGSRNEPGDCNCIGNSVRCSGSICGSVKKNYKLYLGTHG